MKRAIALLAMVLPISMSHAAIRHTVRWSVVADDGAVKTPKSKLVFFARIVPEKLFRLDNDAISSKKGVLAIPKGRLMVQIDGDPTKLCELLEHEGSAFACVADMNGDGAFDTYFGTQVFNAFLTGSTGSDGGFEPTDRPVLASSVAPLTETPLIQLGVRYLGLSNNQIRLQFCAELASPASYGIKYNKTPACQQRPISIPVGESKATLRVYGMTLAITEIASSGAVIELTDRGPNGVMTTSSSFPF